MAIMTKFKRVAGTLTVDELSRAIKNSIDKKGLKDADAKAMAQHILNFFGYGERIIDNMLEPEDRDAFYMLEDSGLLTTEREETTLYDGREWRIHYWLFRKDVIQAAANSPKQETSAVKPEASYSTIYENIPEEVWESRFNSNQNQKRK